ncbi:porin [Glaciimonas sp. GG7]
MHRIKGLVLVAASVAIIGVSSLVQAQSSVAIYGVIDAGITAVTNEGGGHNVRMDDSVNLGNRLGFKGVEDLGDGLKAVFVLENGFHLGTGALRQGGALFGRQAYVGLQNPWGALMLGNQYDFIADYVEEFNVSAFASGYAIHQGDFDRFNMDRLKNAVKFSSAEFNGFKYGAMYSFGEVAGNGHTKSAWSAGAHYTSGPFTTGVAYTRLNNPFGVSALDPFAAIGVQTFLGQQVATVDPVTGAVTDLYSVNAFPVDSQGIVTIGAQYVFGAFSLLGNFTDTTFKGFGQTSQMRVEEIGGTYQLTAALLGVLGYQHTSFEASRWNQISAGMTYALSKRTAIYVSGDYLKASSNTNAVIGYSFTPSSTNRQSDIRIGMHTKF